MFEISAVLLDRLSPRSSLARASLELIDPIHIISNLLPPFASAPG
jgi:hypothetical protein